MGAVTDPAELLEQVDVLVRLDREPAGHPHPAAEVQGHRVLAGVAGGDDIGTETRVLGDQQVEEMVGDFRGAAAAAEEQPALLQLRLGVPGDAHHRVRAVRQVQPGRERLAVLVDRPGHVVVGVDKADVAPLGQRGQRDADEHALALAVADQPVLVDDLRYPGHLQRGGKAGIALMDRERRPLGKTAVLGNGLRFYLVPVHRATPTVGNQHDQTVMWNSREHALNHSACLVHARNDDDQFPFDRPDRIRRHDLAGPTVFGRVVLAAAA